jgi:hypothetical protein
MSTAPTGKSDRPVVLLMTTNGWGMGHLSRQLAVAKALGDRAEPILLSLSGAVHLAAGQGVRAEYVPSPSRGWMTATVWNQYLTGRLLALARETNARAVVFDGVHPYRGLIAARHELPDVAFVWSRRAMWGEGRGDEALMTAPEFDVIIEPGDLGEVADRGLTVGRSDAIKIPPVTILDVIDPLPRVDARAALGLDPEARIALLSLSAGAGDPGRLLNGALDAILASPGWHVAVVSNPLKGRIDLPTGERVTSLTEVYPLARYLTAFDAGIVSAGYNAAHELPLAGVPSVLVANTASAWDDQIARAVGIAERGLALWARDDEPEVVQAKVRELVSGETAFKLVGALRELGDDQRGGAIAAADLVAGLTNGGRAASGPELPREAPQAPASSGDDTAPVATLVERVVPVARNLLRRARRLALRALGRAPATARPSTTKPAFRYVEEAVTTPADAPAANATDRQVLLVTERLTREVIAGPGPVEQLLAGRSPGYREQRLAIARRFFPPAK